MNRLKRKTPSKKRELPDMNRRSFGEWMDADLDDIPEIVKGLVPSVGCGFFAGVPKCGKTWGVLDMALAIASGQTFLGRPTQQINRPVLYIAGEGGISKLLQRIRWLANGRDIPIPSIGNKLHISVAPRILLDRSDGFGALEEEVKTLDAGLVIIDPLTRFHTGDENSRSDVEAPILTPLRHLSEAYELCVCIVHHSPKWHGGRFDPLRGTSAFAGWYDYLLYYEPMTAEASAEKNGNGNGSEIEGYKFCANLRDNEEPPKRPINLSVDPMGEKARLNLTYSDTKCAVLPKNTLRGRITYILKHENTASFTNIRRTIGRNKEQLVTTLKEMESDGIIQKITDEGIIKYKLA
jgi:hypothetical protein